MRYETLNIRFDASSMNGGVVFSERKTRIELGLCPFPSDGVDCPMCGDDQFNLEPADDLGRTVGHCDNCGHHGRVTLKNRRKGGS